VNLTKPIKNMLGMKFRPMYEKIFCLKKYTYFRTIKMFFCFYSIFFIIIFYIF